LTGLQDDDTDAGPATVAASGGDDTAAAPTEHSTELIEAGAAPRPELAWSADTEERETDAISEKRSLALWLVPVMALLAAAIAVASAVLFYIHRAPATTGSATNSRTPAGSPLDGTYRLNFDLAKQTANGLPNPLPNAKPVWWAFRSSCTSTGCVASGTRLDDNNHQATSSNPVHTTELHFVDGHWQRTSLTSSS
jgi:serine/threonine protein kinase, bacterial